MATRYAVLADIHANLPALEAVLDDIQTRGVDGYLVAGDMIGGPQPNEVMDCLRALPNCQMIRGNNENYLLQFHQKSAHRAWWTNKQMAFVRWGFQHLAAEHLEFIASLPEQSVVDEAIRIVHGSPRSASEYFLPDQHPDRFAHAMQITSEAVVIFGHTHLAWQVRQNGRLAFNPGSAGAPMDNDTRPQYAILSRENGQWQTENHRVSYDLALIRQAFMESGLYEYGGGFAHGYLYDMLTGRDILPDFVEYACLQAEAAGFSRSEPIPDEIWEQAEVSYSWPEEFPYQH